MTTRPTPISVRSIMGAGTFPAADEQAIAVKAPADDGPVTAVQPS